MNSNIAAGPAFPSEGRSHRIDAPPPIDAAGRAVRRLTRRASLMLTLLLSLGLWAAIWAAVALVASTIG